jgi:hypothetical protein
MTDNADLDVLAAQVGAWRRASVALRGAGLIDAHLHARIMRNIEEYERRALRALGREGWRDVSDCYDF